jgi:hypothetical protein
VTTASAVIAARINALQRTTAFSGVYRISGPTPRAPLVNQQKLPAQLHRDGRAMRLRAVDSASIL